jgi:hypothetical protein
MNTSTDVSKFGISPFSYHLPLTTVGSNPDRYFGFFQVRKLSRMSMVLLGCPFVPEIMQGRVSEVFLHQ